MASPCRDLQTHPGNDHSFNDKMISPQIRSSMNKRDVTWNTRMIFNTLRLNSTRTKAGACFEPHGGRRSVRLLHPSETFFAHLHNNPRISKTGCSWNAWVQVRVCLERMAGDKWTPFFKAPPPPSLPHMKPVTSQARIFKRQRFPSFTHDLPHTACLLKRD